MKANELRIGNYIIPITSDGFKLEQRPIHAREFWLLSNEPDKAEPIPLTEEWLIKFGFEKEKNVIPIYSIGKISIYLDCEMYPNGRVYFNSWCILKEKPKYVHKLQNLYFALTGEELILKQ